MEHTLGLYGIHMDMTARNSNVSMRIPSGEDKNCHEFGCTVGKSVQS